MKALALWLLGAVAVLGGCAQGRPMNLTEFRGTCWSVQSPRCQRGDICTAYRDQLDQPFENVDACVNACREKARLLGNEYMFSSCQGAAVGVASQCESYCRRNYGPNGALFPEAEIR